MADVTEEGYDLLVVENAKLRGQVERLEERSKTFEDNLRLMTDAHARADMELGQVTHDLEKANILANRYSDLLCVILALAEGRQDLTQEVALVVQEARAVCGNA